MQPTPLTAHHLAYWIRHEDVIETPRPVLYGSDNPEVDSIETVVTKTAAGEVIRVPWKPDEIDLAHLARGGTLWFSSLGGLAPHVIEVQAPENNLQPRDTTGSSTS